MLESKAGDLTEKGHWFRIWMPYCFQAVESEKKTVWLPLNRNYKPLGYPGKEFLDYKKYIDQAVQFKRDPRTFQNIWIDEPAADTLQLWLYDDSPKSRTDYFARLELLTVKMPKLVGPSELV